MAKDGRSGRSREAKKIMLQWHSCCGRCTSNEGRGFDSGRIAIAMRIGRAGWRRRNHSRKHVMSKYLTLIAAAAVLLAMAPARAQQAQYPNRPIKILVCLPSGRGVDTVTRLRAARLAHPLRPPI